MKKFIVKVDGNSYEVEVEEIIGGATAQSATQAPQAAPAPTPAPTPQPAAAPEAPASKPVAEGATTVNAPMPGTILDIKVNEGDTIEKGQVLCVLEAMKMENEIMAPTDGTVASVNTSKGASVESGDILFSIE